MHKVDATLESPITTRRLMLLAGRAAEAWSNPSFMTEHAEAVRGAAGASAGQVDVADSRAFISRARLIADAPVFVIHERADRRPVGAAAIAPMVDNPKRQELSLFVDPREWGRGYATEAAQALIDRHFCGTGADALWAVTRVTNEGARRVLEKCGFQIRERGMARSVSLRGAVPVERFALDRRTWIGLKAWGVSGHDDARVPAA